MGKRVLTPEEAIAMGLPADGPGVPSIPKKPQSKAETALHHFGQGASFGFTDEGRGLMAGVGELSQMMREGVGLEEKTSQRSALQRLIRAYEEERNAARGDIKKGEADNPKTAFLSSLAGSLAAPTPLKGGSMAKQGAVSGALYGLGSSEGKGLDLVEDTATGGALGGVTGKVLGGASNWLKRGAEERALRAAGAQKPDFSMLAKMSPSGDRMSEARRLGRRLLELEDDAGKKVLGTFDNPEAIAPKLAKVTDETGQAIGGHVDVMQDAIKNTVSPRASFPPLPAGAPEFAPVTGRPVSMVEIGQKLLAEADEAALQPGKKAYADSLRKEAQTLLQQAEERASQGGYASLTLPEAEAAKRGLAGSISPADWLTSTTKPAAEAKKQASRMFRKGSEDAIEGLVGPDEKAVFKSLKDRYKDVRTLRDIAQRGEISEAARMPMGLTEQNAMLGALSTAAGAPPLEQLAKAGGAGLLSRLTRGRGDAMAGRAMDAAKEVPGKYLLNAANEEIQQLTPEEEQRRRLLSLLGGD